MSDYGAVSVDDHFARFGSKSYAINKINSVDVRVTTKAGSLAYFVWWFFAFVFLMSLMGGQNIGFNVVAIIVCGFFGYQSFKKRKAVNTFHLFLMMSSNETQAISSENRGYIDGLRDEIEQAMARQ